jgi:hypothetical protein
MITPFERYLEVDSECVLHPSIPPLPPSPPLLPLLPMLPLLLTASNPPLEIVIGIAPPVLVNAATRQTLL